MSYKVFFYWIIKLFKVIFSMSCTFEPLNFIHVSELMTVAAATQPNSLWNCSTTLSLSIFLFFSFHIVEQLCMTASSPFFFFFNIIYLSLIKLIYLLLQIYFSKKRSRSWGRKLEMKGKTKSKQTQIHYWIKQLWNSIFCV